MFLVKGKSRRPRMVLGWLCVCACVLTASCVCSPRPWGLWMRRTWDQDLRRVKVLLEQGPSAAPLSEPEEDTVSRSSSGAGPVCVVDRDHNGTDEHRAHRSWKGSALTGPDGAVAMDPIRSFLMARLPRAPMLFRILRPTRIGQGPPAWIDTAVFDIAEHVLLAPADRPLGTRRTFSTGAPAVRWFRWTGAGHCGDWTLSLVSLEGMWGWCWCSTMSSPTGCAGSPWSPPYWT